MVRIIEQAEGHYEAHEVEEFGRVYRWYPESVVVECDCGERLTLTAYKTTCGCGVDHAAIIREELFVGRPVDETLRSWGDEWRRDGRLRSEDDYREELNDID